jgi:hypothetical protein
MYTPQASRKKETKAIRTSPDTDAEPVSTKRRGCAAMKKYKYLRATADLLLPNAALKLTAATRAGHSRPTIGLGENKSTCRENTQATRASSVLKRRGARVENCVMSDAV